MDNNRSSGKYTKVSLIVMIVMGVIAIALAGLTYYFYNQYQAIKKNPNQANQAEVDRIVGLVGKLIDLPKDETPTLATVLDKDKLKDQPFFANTQNGDVILIYTKAKKAIVYRQKDNKLINVGPISIDETPATPIALVAAGGNVDDITKKLNEKLAGKVSIVSTTDAKSRSSVKQLTVVDTTGQNAEAAKIVADAIGASVGTLPSGETAPAGATLVIFVK